LLLSLSFGVGNAGWMQKTYLSENPEFTEPSYESTSTVLSPILNKLASSGVVLMNQVGYQSCTPSRAALMSGRWPIYLGVQLGDPSTWDGGYNATWGYEGLPTSMTTMAKQLKTAGYSTYHIGKSDGFGSLTEAHVSTGRGFDDALTYAHHGTDNYAYTVGLSGTAAPPPCLGINWPNGSNYEDLWDGEQGANPAKYPTGTYKEEYFVERAMSKIRRTTRLRRCSCTTRRAFRTHRYRCQTPTSRRWPTTCARTTPTA
jgi:arylsulfatase A-like enzyme